jgi:hypothetical protein
MLNPPPTVGVAVATAARRATVAKNFMVAVVG